MRAPRKVTGAPRVLQADVAKSFQTHAPDRAMPWGVVAARSLVFLLIPVAALAGCRRPRAHAASSASSAPRAAPPPSQTAFYASTFERTPSPKEMTAIGRALFFAPELSAAGTMSCASCHDPEHAYGPPAD